MEHRDIAIGYEHMVHVRIKRKRDPEWRVATSVMELPIRCLSLSEAPLAGRFEAGAAREEYRAIDGRLYRTAGHMWNGAFEPLMLEALTPGLGQKAGAAALPLISRMPWKRHDRRQDKNYPDLPADRLYDDPVAEQLQDLGPTELLRVSPRAHELVAVDGQIFCPAAVPMVEVHGQQISVKAETSLDLDNGDPEVNRYAGHFGSLFSFDRRQDACDFARNYAASSGLSAFDLGLPAAELRIEPGYEDLFVVDDLIESARRNLAYAAYHLGQSAMSRDTAGLAAYCDLRETVFAMERPEGRTRANARRAYAAAAALASSPAGPFAPAGEASIATEWIKRVLSLSTARADWDKTFADTPEETIDADEQAALAVVAGL